MPLRTELTHFGFNVKSDHLVSPLIQIESFFIYEFLTFLLDGYTVINYYFKKNKFSQLLF